MYIWTVIYTQIKPFISELKWHTPPLPFFIKPGCRSQWMCDFIFSQFTVWFIRVSNINTEPLGIWGHYAAITKSFKKNSALLTQPHSRTFETKVQNNKAASETVKTDYYIGTGTSKSLQKVQVQKLYKSERNIQFWIQYRGTNQ